MSSGTNIYINIYSRRDDPKEINSMSFISAQIGGIHIILYYYHVERDIILYIYRLPKYNRIVLRETPAR